MSPHLRLARFALCVSLSLAARKAVAQPDAAPAPPGVTAGAGRTRLVVLTGLNQPLTLRGGNFAFVATLPNGFSMEASFGIGLDYQLFLTPAERMRYSHVRSPVTGGVGIGYDFLHRSDRHGLGLYFEPKATVFDVDPMGAAPATTYLTYTLGVGLYYTFRIWRGLVVQPSVRYWHPVASSLPGDRFEYVDAAGATQVHQRRAPGLNGVILNVSVGWDFGV